MAPKIIIFSFLCFISISIFAQDFQEYYKIINQAELLALRNEDEKALQHYDSAFKLFPPLGFHLLNAAVCAANIKNISHCVTLLEKAVLCGYQLSNLTYRFYTIEYLIKDSLYLLFVNQSYYELRQQFSASLNKDLSNKILRMANQEQLIRMDNRGMPDSVWQGAIRRLQIKNFYELMQLTRQHGWMHSKNVGVDAANAAIMMLFSGSKYFDAQSDEMIFFENILKNELKKGTILPFNYAQFIDHHKYFTEQQQQLYGTFTDDNLRILPIADIHFVDQRRTKIGLEPLQDFAAKHNYLLPIDYKQK